MGGLLSSLPMVIRNKTAKTVVYIYFGKNMSKYMLASYSVWYIINC